MTYTESYDFFSSLFDELYPILRSITGPGLRQSYDIFSRYMPLEQESFKSGTNIYDWTVPKEWHCTSATLVGPNGDIVADMQRSNIEVINYSAPFKGKIELEDLMPHLHSIPSRPTVIPYVTSYYQPRWGFCVPDSVKNSLMPGTYSVDIDSQFIDGALDLVHCVLPGMSEQEILITSYLCHPSLANNELSGPLVLLGLFKRLEALPNRRYTYRFVLNPESIGALAYLSKYGEYLKSNVVAGMVLNCMGGDGDHLEYKLSRNENSILDRFLKYKFKDQASSTLVSFTPLKGSDERQYCSPGFQIPICNVSRNFHIRGCDKYHTSLDNKHYMDIDKIISAIGEVFNIIVEVDSIATFESQCPFGEPNLGRRGLYPTLSHIHSENQEKVELFNNIKLLLNFADGCTDTLTVAERFGMDVAELSNAICELEAHKLIKQV
ncbi:DUF4910 domain-containing protein [Pseudoalteromonas xiamenensis]|uniref:DUF4910 domain-containing protein n=1 Tax=Pseudoalteromonas xiamenensis TaxID=882626 RepID=A0A975HKH7_9GAMM|nr:DUF4910 domain-containing protein [Pseudoalteromonas xiamenensis]QTH71033.1 DUF4910 domain-containing protein [Pseudoalteromonas xiamenensis]